jgi:tetratricopeptide (TPR) repeat protein
MRKIKMPQDPLEIVEKAEILFFRGDYRESLELLGHAEKAALESQRRDALAAVYITIGNNLIKLGDFELAKKFLEISLKISEELAEVGPYYHTWVAMTLNSLGNLLGDMGRPEDAKNRYERALEMYEKLLKTDTSSSVYQSDVAMTLNNLGTLLRDMGRP